MPKFRLLAGRHTQGKAQAGTYPDGRPKMEPVIYHKGDVFESNIDLDKRFNGATHDTWKFERVSDDTPCVRAGAKPKRTAEADTAVAVAEGDAGELSEMTVEELKELAAVEEIELGKAKTKDQIIQAILAGRE